MATVTEMLRLSVKPAIGMVRNSSARAEAFSVIPPSSVPKIRAVFPFERSKSSRGQPFERGVVATIL